MTLDPALWHEAKELIRSASAWPMSTLHVIGGVIVQLLAAAVMKSSLARPGPWLAVLILELANEAYDLWVERWPSLSMQLGEGLLDLAATMILPTILWRVARRRPRLLAGR